jgi:hypothetical protein
MTTTNEKTEKTIEKNIIDSFGKYITKNYENIKTYIEIFEDTKTDIFDERPNPLFPNCQGCIEGQPNQEAHINWGGCLSMCDEGNTVEELEEDTRSTSSYCSTTSYESDGGNATSTTIHESASYDGQLGLPSASTILTRRRTNSN